MLCSMRMHDTHDEEATSAWPSGSGLHPEGDAAAAAPSVSRYGADVVAQLERVIEDLSVDVVVVGPPDSELLGGVLRRSVTVELARQAPHVVVVVPRKCLESVGAA